MLLVAGCGAQGTLGKKALSQEAKGIQSLAAEGVSPREAAERLKKNRFYVEKLFEQAANFAPDELRHAIVRLAELDLALKGGSRLAGELEFSRALVDLTRPREVASSTSR